MKSYACNLFGTVYLHIIDPKMIQDFKMNPDNYKKNEKLLQIYYEDLGEGLLYAHGKQWKKHRKLTSTVFHFEFLKSNIPVVKNIAKQVFEGVSKESLERVDLMDKFQ